MNQSSPPAQFPGRISRRLSLAFAGFIAIVLVVGGISLTLAVRIYRINHTVNEENTHIQLIDQIDSAFTDIISELQRMQAVGQFDRLERVLTLHEKLGPQLEAFRSVQQNEKDFPEDQRQIAAISDLQSLARQLRALTDRVLATPGRGRHLSPADLDWLNLTSQQANDKIEYLRSAHRLEIASFLQASEGTGATHPESKCTPKANVNSELLT